jgi:hypothetical protein
MLRSLSSTGTVLVLATALTAAATVPAQAVVAGPAPTFVQPKLYRAAPANLIEGDFALADFNRDGHLDVASAGGFNPDTNSTTPRGLPVQLGDGAGHLGPGILTTLPSQNQLETPLAIAAGDVNGDGKPDLATATLDLVQSGTQTLNVYRVRVLLGRGDGTFTVLAGFSLPAEVTHLVLADFTGDGRLDLGYATNAPQGARVWTAVGRGDASFAAPVAITPTQSSPVNTLAAVDLNGDTRPDLVYGEGCVIAQLNAGGGSFGPPICSPLGVGPVTMVVADLNADGRPDVALGDASGGNVLVALGDGTGHFTAAHTYLLVAGQVISLVAADIDGDGRPDLVASGDADRIFQAGIAVLRGAGDGSFRLVSRWVTGGAHLAVGDFTSDGRPDLVSEDNRLHDPALLTINAGRGRFVAPQLTVTPAKRTGGQLGTDVLSADLNHDGRPDVILIAGTVAIVYLNRGGGAFLRWSGPVISVSSGRILSAALGDLNGDGNLDLALGGLPNINVTVLLGRGDASFAAPVTYNNGSGAAAGSIAVSDVTGDGIPDIVTNTFTALSVLPGTGNGTFGVPRLSGFAQPNQSFLRLVDLNGDGRLDAVGAAMTGTPDDAQSQVLTELNAGGGQFTAVSTTTLATNIRGGTVVADLTGDGRPDLALTGAKGTHTGITGIFVLPGNGTGLGAPIIDRTTLTPGAIAAADYNRDGAIDLATTTIVDVGVFTNPGNGQFAPDPTTSIITPFDSVALTSADFTGDGKPDLVAFMADNPPEFALDVNNTP